MRDPPPGGWPGRAYVHVAAPTTDDQHSVPLDALGETHSEADATFGVAHAGITAETLTAAERVAAPNYLRGGNGSKPRYEVRARRD